jgi:hypothetical protein
MAPLFEDHCMQCHREGGIAPFRLDDPEIAKAHAPAIRAATAARTMPPWGVTSDGSCGEFKDSIALSDAQIALIADWVENGAPEGTPTKITLPDVPSLARATELSTPLFTPEIVGGPLAEHDEYRCFVLEPGVSEAAFITGYEVLPGQPSVIHHVIAMLVDPSAPARVPGQPGMTNLEQMQALDAESPDREGWPCFGMAGEGIEVESSPVNWAPGQYVVQYPSGSGVPIRPEQRFIVQVHYNLADHANLGKSDQTRIRLRLDSEVEKVGAFILVDPFLGSLDQPMPDTLPPGRASAPYSWNATLKQLGLGELSGVELHGVMPHMHELGNKYKLRVNPDGSAFECAADVQNWDFHWQRLYFYKEPFKLTADSALEVTCDFDTSSRVEPVLPGWGTSNEMCLANLYFTIPRSELP